MRTATYSTETPLRTGSRTSERRKGPEPARGVQTAAVSCGCGRSAGPRARGAALAQPKARKVAAVGGPDGLSEGETTVENREETTKEVSIEAVDPSPSRTGERGIQPQFRSRGKRSPGEGQGPLGPARTRAAETETSATGGAQEAQDGLAEW